MEIHVKKLIYAMNPKDYKDIIYNIIGAAMEVHSTLRWGLLEEVYAEALQLELKDNGISSEREGKITCYYKNHELEKFYKTDLKSRRCNCRTESCKQDNPCTQGSIVQLSSIDKTANRITHQLRPRESAGRALCVH